MLKRPRRAGVTLAAVLVLAGCADDRSSPAQALRDVQSRSSMFPNYPQGEVTYLSYSHAHGFQVNFIAGDGTAWLWYPGNSKGVPEIWKISSDGRLVCWQHPQNSSNPVTGTTGGTFACEPRELAQKTVISSLPGDVFHLRTGRIPYRRDKCTAPDWFAFDRAAFGC